MDEFLEQGGRTLEDSSRLPRPLKEKRRKRGNANKPNNNTLGGRVRYERGPLVMIALAVPDYPRNA
jgi:hypothetical protein